MKLQHLSTKRVAESGIFNDLASYDDLIGKIARHGKMLSEPGEEGYNDFVGGAFEVYAEFFCQRYGTSANPLLGIKHIEDTSRNKFQVGYDFTYESFEGDACMLQVKYKSSPLARLSRSDLGTFVSIADEFDVTKKHRILFTCLDEQVEGGVFAPGYDGFKQMRVIGRSIQEDMIDRDPNFWRDLAFTVNQALIAPSEFLELQKLWEHQERMSASCQPILTGTGNGRVICATGGGKTRVILQNAIDGFRLGFKTIVVVAPTIDLLRQHHAYFEKYGLFHRDGISVIHFRTGDECKDNWADIRQTTSVNDVQNWLTPKTVIFVTYASEFKLLDGMRVKGMSVDLILWDEFHHTVRQDSEQKDHLLSLPTKRNIFYSASIKRGRIVSGTDESIYGPVLQEIKYAELRLIGVLVPKIIVKVIKLRDGSKIQGLEKAMKKAANQENFDLKTATIEAAGTIAAYEDKRLDGNVNMVTFSKAVPICKELVGNPNVREHFSGLLETVHAEIQSRDRKKIYELVRTSTDSVLCQFSVVKEGIDINPFNAVVFSRNMDVIGTQQAIGRAVRANPEDTANLKEGKISINDPTGWKKYSATLYVIIHEDVDITFKDFLVDLAVKLQFAGLDVDDLAFQDVEDGKHGTTSNNDSWIEPLDKELNKIRAISLKAAVQAVVIEMEEMQEFDHLLSKFAAKDWNEQGRLDAQTIKSVDAKVKSLGIVRTKTPAQALAFRRMKNLKDKQHVLVAYSMSLLDATIVKIQSQGIKPASLTFCSSHEESLDAARKIGVQTRKINSFADVNTLRQPNGKRFGLVLSPKEDLPNITWKDGGGIFMYSQVLQQIGKFAPDVEPTMAQWDTIALRLQEKGFNPGGVKKKTAVRQMYAWALSRQGAKDEGALHSCLFQRAFAIIGGYMNKEDAVSLLIQNGLNPVFAERAITVFVRQIRAGFPVDLQLARDEIGPALRSDGTEIDVKIRKKRKKATEHEMGIQDSQKHAIQ
jgi:superfamily II DNA or RNA helicase